MLTAREDSVFRAYIKANGLTQEAVFGKGVTYRCPDGISRKKEDIIGSSGFAGFVDGFENRLHKYKAAVGTPEKKFVPKKYNQSIQLLDSLHDIDLDQIDLDYIANRLVSVVYPDYDRQYELGRTMSAK